MALKYFFKKISFYFRLFFIFISCFEKSNKIVFLTQLLTPTKNKKNIPTPTAADDNSGDVDGAAVHNYNDNNQVLSSINNNNNNINKQEHQNVFKIHEHHPHPLEDDDMQQDFISNTDNETNNSNNFDSNTSNFIQC